MLRIFSRSRSEHENSCFSQSTSYISIFSEHFAIFVGSPSRIFSDFRKFHVFQRFSCIVLNVSRRQKHSKCVHLNGFCVDPSNFQVKIHEIPMLFAKCYLNVAKSAPDMKIRVFWKALPKRGQNVIFHLFL